MSNSKSNACAHRLVGHCIEVGDDDAGQPRLVISTTRDEILRFGGNLAFADVEVRLRPNSMSENGKMLDHLLGLLDDMLSNAQTLRIQQSHATAEAGWGKHLTEKADAAWQHLNEAHKAAIGLLQPNTSVSGPCPPDGATNTNQLSGG